MPSSVAPQRLYKREKLCSRKAIETLFARDASAPGLSSFLAFPLRAVWRVDPAGAPAPQFLISVPKRRLRHAVDRVRIRRLLREAWRLHREAIPAIPGLQIGFVYVAPALTDFPRVERALLRILARVTEGPAASTDAPSAGDNSTAETSSQP